MLHLAVVIVKGTKNAIPNKVIHAEWTNICSYVYCCFNLNIGLVNKSRNWNLIVTYVSWEVTPTATEFRCSHKFPYEMFAQFFLILLLVFFSKLATGRCTNKSSKQLWLILKTKISKNLFITQQQCCTSRPSESFHIILSSYPH